MRDYPFELVGGHPALDFLNTIPDWHARERVDRLGEFGDVVAFAAAAGVIGSGDTRQLRKMHSPAELRHLGELRERLARIFRGISERAGPAPADLNLLALDAARAASLARLRSSDGRIVRRIAIGDAGAEIIRWRIVDASVELLTSEQLAHVKSCPSCGWFFLDTTKNKSRRWCSMTMCGSASKARRYYRRKRRRAGGRSHPTPDGDPPNGSRAS